MECSLHVQWFYKDALGRELPSDVVKVTAEIAGLPSRAGLYPSSLAGRIIKISPSLLAKLKAGDSAPARITFSGKKYKFNKLEDDGTFELQKDWQE
jgi:hypothetical protein